MYSHFTLGYLVFTVYCRLFQLLFICLQGLYHYVVILVLWWVDTFYLLVTYCNLLLENINNVNSICVLQYFSYCHWMYIWMELKTLIELWYELWLIFKAVLLRNWCSYVFVKMCVFHDLLIIQPSTIEWFDNLNTSLPIHHVLSFVDYVSCFVEGKKIRFRSR